MTQSDKLEILGAIGASRAGLKVEVLDAIKASRTELKAEVLDAIKASRTELKAEVLDAIAASECRLKTELKTELGRDITEAIEASEARIKTELRAEIYVTVDMAKKEIYECIQTWAGKIDQDMATMNATIKRIDETVSGQDQKYVRLINDKITAHELAMHRSGSST